MRDHMLNWQLPAQPLGPAIRKQSKPEVWPFPLPPEAPTFVADCRTMDSDRPGFKSSLTLSLKEAPEKPAQAEPQADAAGWIKHDGGDCPLPEGTPVEARMRRGDVKRGKALQTGFTHRNWQHEVKGAKGYDYLSKLDIMAYRVVSA